MRRTSLECRCYYIPYTLVYYPMHTCYSTPHLSLLKDYLIYTCRYMRYGESAPTCDTHLPPRAARRFLASPVYCTTYYTYVLVLYYVANNIYNIPTYTALRTHSLSSYQWLVYVIRSFQFCELINSCLWIHFIVRS